MSLVNFLIALGSVIAFAIFEKIQKKADYNLKTVWFKYACALVLGTFFKNLADWNYFQYLEEFAFVVAFLYFFMVIIGALKIKKLPQ